MTIARKFISTAVNSLFLIGVVFLVAACSSPEDRAQSHYERGIKLLDENDYVRASLEIRNALRLKEDMAPAWVALSRIEEHNKNWDAVGRILRRIVTLNPEDAESKVRLSRLMFLAGNLDDALTLSESAIDLNAENSFAHSLRAAVLLRIGDAAGAVRDANAALALNPDNFEASIVLAANRVARGDTDGALGILEKGGAADEKNVAVQLFKMKILESRNDLPKIEAILLQLVKHYPQESAFRQQLVRFYMHHGRRDEAETQLRAIAAANPTDVEAGLDVVRFLQATSGPDAARRELLKRVSEVEDPVRYQLALADFYFFQNHDDDAIHLLESVASAAGTQENAHAAYVKLAEMHMRRKRPAVAEKLVNQVLAEDRRNIGALRLRATLNMNKNEYESAILDLREALNDAPRDADLVVMLAAAFERSGSIELADERLAYAMRVSNFEPRYGLQYVAFLQRRGNLARAEDMLLQLVNRSPNNQDVLATLAQIRLARQDWVGAQEIADNLARLDKSSGLARQILGESFAGQRKLDESIAILQGAYEATPEALQPMAALVRAYVRAQKLDEAESFLTSIVTTDPGNAEAQVLLGSVELMRDERDSGLERYHIAIKNQPQNPVGYRALATWHLRQGEHDEAIKIVRAGIKERPEHTPLRLMLAQALELTGDFEAAIAEYDLLVQEQPGSVIFANNLASLLLDHRTDAESLEKAGVLAARLRKSPIPHFKDTLGWLHYRRGEYKAAVVLLEEAARELPDLPVVQYHLGVSYIAEGQVEKGVEHLKKALELLPNGGVSEEAVREALRKAETT